MVRITTHARCSSARCAAPCRLLYRSACSVRAHALRLVLFWLLHGLPLRWFATAVIDATAHVHTAHAAFVAAVPGYRSYHCLVTTRFHLPHRTHTAYVLRFWLLRLYTAVYRSLRCPRTRLHTLRFWFAAVYLTPRGCVWLPVTRFCAFYAHTRVYARLHTYTVAVAVTVILGSTHRYIYVRTPTAVRLGCGCWHARTVFAGYHHTRLPVTVGFVCYRTHTAAVTFTDCLPRFYCGFYVRLVGYVTFRLHALPFTFVPLTFTFTFLHTCRPTFVARVAVTFCPVDSGSGSGCYHCLVPRFCSWLHAFFTVRRTTLRCSLPPRFTVGLLVCSAAAPPAFAVGSPFICSLPRCYTFTGLRFLPLVGYLATPLRLPFCCRSRIAVAGSALPGYGYATPHTPVLPFYRAHHLVTHFAVVPHTRTTVLYVYYVYLRILVALRVTVTVLRSLRTFAHAVTRFTVLPHLFTLPHTACAVRGSLPVTGLRLRFGWLMLPCLPHGLPHTHAARLHTRILHRTRTAALRVCYRLRLPLPRSSAFYIRIRFYVTHLQFCCAVTFTATTTFGSALPLHTHRFVTTPLPFYGLHTATTTGCYLPTATRVSISPTRLRLRCAVTVRTFSFTPLHVHACRSGSYRGSVPRLTLPAVGCLPRRFGSRCYAVVHTRARSRAHALPTVYVPSLRFCTARSHGSRLHGGSARVCGLVTRTFAFAAVLHGLTRFTVTTHVYHLPAWLLRYLLPVVTAVYYARYSSCRFAFWLVAGCYLWLVALHAVAYTHTTGLLLRVHTRFRFSCSWFRYHTRYTYGWFPCHVAVIAVTAAVTAVTRVRWVLTPRLRLDYVPVLRFCVG